MHWCADGVGGVGGHGVGGVGRGGSISNSGDGRGDGGGGAGRSGGHGDHGWRVLVDTVEALVLLQIRMLIAVSSALMLANNNGIIRNNAAVEAWGLYKLLRNLGGGTPTLRTALLGGLGQPCDSTAHFWTSCSRNSCYTCFNTAFTKELWTLKSGRWPGILDSRVGPARQHEAFKSLALLRRAHATLYSTYCRPAAIGPKTLII